MTQLLTISPTSSLTAECDCVVLRETKTTRLIFKPMLVDNPKSTEAAIHGWFIVQKKGLKGHWEDYNSLSLSDLRNKEWGKLELHSSELLHLYQTLAGLYRLYDEEGIPRQETRFLRVESHLAGLLEASEEEFTEFLQANNKLGVDILSRLIHWAAQTDNAAQAVDRLEQLKGETLLKLNTLVGIAALNGCLRVWEENTTNSDEEFWQRTLAENSFVLSQIFAYPVLVIRGKAYVGGKSFANQGGNVVDFLARNNVTKNAVLIEIKTPTTPLLGAAYRSNFAISSELTGAIVQASNYARSLESSYSQLSLDDTVEIFHPQCVVIAGNLAKEAIAPNKRKSLELFRGQLKDIQIVTYDELFDRSDCWSISWKGRRNQKKFRSRRC